MDRRKLLEETELFVLDMDGTFYLGGQLIDGSLDFIDKVVSSGRDFMFLTNNSSHNANFYVQKLAKMGLSIDRSKVMTSGEATCEKLNELYPGKRCFVLGNDFLKAEFAEAGIAVDDENPEVVVIGFDNTEISTVCTPSITTVSQPRFQMGYTACEILLEKINDPSMEPRSILLETELIIREST